MDASPASAVVQFFARDWVYVFGVGICSFTYLLVDLFIVIRRFASILRTRSFWLFWICITSLNLLAFEALRKAQDSATNFGPAQGFALIVMSTLGTITILQSFALKIGDRKVVDVSKFVDDFRATVLEDISRRQAVAGQKLTRETAARLYEALRDNPSELHRTFVSVMSFGGRDTSQVLADLARIRDDAAALEVPEALLLAKQIAQADVREAERIVRRVKWDTEVVTGSSKAAKARVQSQE